MNGASDGDHKPLYCHWDTHDDDVLFSNEAELDRHIYGHFMPNLAEPAYLAPTPASPEQRPEPPLSSGQTIECHWDACHELFEIDQIMQHLRDSHMQGSLHPHLHECDTATHGCTLPSPKSEISVGSSMKKEGDEAAYVRLNADASGMVGPSMAGTSMAGTSMAGTGMANADMANADMANADMAGTDMYACTCGTKSGGCCGGGSCCAAPSMASRIDPASLPRLQAASPSTGASGLDAYCCMWCMPNGSCCGRTFMTSPELHAHISHSHVMENPASMCSCGWKGCPRDGKPFGQRQKLLRHLQTHAKTFEFKCRICGRALSCESMRRVHERAHSNEKPFKCEVCGRRFRANSGLIVHQRTHTGEKPLQCKFPGCSKRFAESSNLAKHMRTHQEKSFECHLCQRKFTRKDHLLRHQKTRCRLPQQQPQQQQQPTAAGLMAHAAPYSPQIPYMRATDAPQMPDQQAGPMPPAVQPSVMYAMHTPAAPQN